MLFQSLTAATGKAPLPTVDSLTDDTTTRLENASLVDQGDQRRGRVDQSVLVRLHVGRCTVCSLGPATMSERVSASVKCGHGTSDGRYSCCVEYQLELADELSTPLPSSATTSIWSVAVGIERRI